jgi:hypothetical protein
MNGSARPRCVSFWYYMYEPIVDTTGPNLGKLAIWTRTIDKSVTSEAALIKKQKKFGSYIRKLRRERLQSHM